MDIYIGIITHRHGHDLFACKTEELAYDEIADYVKENWEPELKEPFPEGPTRDDLILEYFERVEGEFQEVRCVTLVEE